MLRYYRKFLTYFFTSVAVGALDMFICSHFLVGHGWLSIIAHAAICAVTVPGTLVLITFNTDEGRYVRRLAGREIKTIRKKLLRKKAR